VEDVPPGALALSRAPQLNKPGYAEKKRARREEEQVERRLGVSTAATSSRR
jgi:hypothetical protein